MLDRAKEAMFSTLGGNFEGERVLDLFSGTGSLGLEALSRGASEVWFFERHRAALTALRKNIETLGAEDVTHVSPADATQPAGWPEEVDLAFLDPPYPLWRTPQGRDSLYGVVELLLAERLTPRGIVALHTSRREERDERLRALAAEWRTYGTTTLWYFQRD